MLEKNFAADVLILALNVNVNDLNGAARVSLANLIKAANDAILARVMISSMPVSAPVPVGESKQATLPVYDPKAITPDRGDELITVHDDKTKKRRRCGTPGCNLADHHFGPHSGQSFAGKRSCPRL